MPAFRLARLPLFCLLLALAARGVCRADAFSREILAASGVPAEQVAHYAAMLDRLGLDRLGLDRLGGEFLSHGETSGEPLARAEEIHGFLHEHVLRGGYRADASDLAVALDGGAFNCAAVTALFLVLADRSGLAATAVSTPGHVWCRVKGGAEQIDIETTCRDWFAIREKWQGVPTEPVSDAMAEHRRRVAVGRELSRGELAAVFHFNRGVTLIREQQFVAAAEANLRALVLDPCCRPACENFAFAVAHQLRRPSAAPQSGSQFMLRLGALAWQLQATKAAAKADSQPNPAAAYATF